MFDSWSKLEPLFQTLDGALPDIELNQLLPRSVVLGYEYIRDNSVWPTGYCPSYWSRVKGADVEFTQFDNPAKYVVEESADSFHLCFDSITSPSGYKVPNLGVFIFLDSISFDYRAGPDWNVEAIRGLFEVIAHIYGFSREMKLKHKLNIYDDDGSILESAWESYKND
ncbi:MAG: hypothetical protein KUG73_04480 [Pseudomonadales bacterium]|nr:hypothetical protein [Pseudomonadales bacterium]